MQPLIYEKFIVFFQRLYGQQQSQDDNFDLTQFVLVAPLFHPLAMSPLPLEFMIAAPHFLFMALMFPPLASPDFFPLSLESLFFEPLTMAPGPLGFLRLTMDTELIAVVVLLTPATEFPFLLNASSLPVPFLFQAFLV